MRVKVVGLMWGKLASSKETRKGLAKIIKYNYLILLVPGAGIEPAHR
jgi:hypothetical protein